MIPITYDSYMYVLHNMCYRVCLMSSSLQRYNIVMALTRFIDFAVPLSCLKEREDCTQQDKRAFSVYNAILVMYHPRKCLFPVLTLWFVCNGHAYGVFVLAFLYLLSLNVDGLYFDQADVRYMREKCILSLVQGKIAHFSDTVQDKD